jgi:hypothetical protein
MSPGRPRPVRFFYQSFGEVCDQFLSLTSSRSGQDQDLVGKVWELPLPNLDVAPPSPETLILLAGAAGMAATGGFKGEGFLRDVQGWAPQGGFSGSGRFPNRPKGVPEFCLEARGLEYRSRDRDAGYLRDFRDTGIRDVPGLRQCLVAVLLTWRTYGRL